MYHASFGWFHVVCVLCDWKYPIRDFAYSLQPGAIGKFDDIVATSSATLISLTTSTNYNVLRAVV